MELLTREAVFISMEPLTEPSSHPLKGDTFQERLVRVFMLSNLCTDYARSVQLLVDSARAQVDPYPASDGKGLLAITAAREVMRTAAAVAKTAKMDELFASAIRDQLKIFQSSHPHLRMVRDVIAHVDEYVASKGNDSDQWFDTTNRFEADSWILRIGNKLDIEMVQLASDTNDLAAKVKEMSLKWFVVEKELDRPSSFVTSLMELGICASLEISGDVGTLTILDVKSQND